MVLSNEQRVNQRVNTYLDSTIKIQNSQDTSITKNISETGAYIISQASFEPGTVMDCVILFDDRSIDFTGKVVRVSQHGDTYGYGVKIEDIEEDNQRMLSDYVRENITLISKNTETEFGADYGFGNNLNTDSGAGQGFDQPYIKSNGIESRTVQAGFPSGATLESFDFTNQTPEVKTEIDALLSMGWVEKAENVILFGSMGSGKTHLAVSIGKKAIEEGYKTTYTKISDLVYALRKERESANDRYRVERMLESRVIVIDDLGLAPLTQSEKNLLFQFFMKLYGKTSIVMTTELTFEELKQTIGDSTIATLLLDRLAHNVWLRGMLN